MTSTPNWNYVNSAVYADDPKACSKAYSKWAAVYDYNMASLESVGNQNMINIAIDYIKTDEASQMLDVAAGTGWTAQFYKDAGFKGQIDGIEMSSEMLDLAIAKKGLYRKTYCQAVTETDPLPVEENKYDVVTAAGAFVTNHLPPGCIPHLVKVLNSGGLLVFNSRNTDQNAEYLKKLTGYLDQLVNEKRIELVKKEEILFYGKNSTESGKPMTAFVFIYRKF